MTVDIRVVRAGQRYRYYLRETVVGDGRRPARTPLHITQEQAGVPVGRWTGRGLALLELTPGEEVTEAQPRNLFGERGRHPYADRIEADRLAAGGSPKEAFKAGALGRRVTVTVTVTGVDFVFRPQPTMHLLWALGGEETRLVSEAAHERAIVRVLEWIEDEVAVIRYDKDGIYRVRPGASPCCHSNCRTTEAGWKGLSVAIASNESFGGWTKTFTDPRLCAAIVDRLTFNGTVIETGTDSYRLASIRARAEEPAKAG
ncbi:relaxase domain-containing protein [Streptomyces sp. TP-A0874]|uniref:relaxase domain-containing protein n=1 Tax=Streptomyces sp. TP-A0874 TaxID=549819 RepID=UPI0008537F3D